ncbi:hypothetical protein [Pseudoalteromonas phenolica]|uniref:hypothetical protein n=1 Tax=Pseudoalteromonas phenolica TaxID=161398 RepID=UPI00110ACC37|nr:hypothetical protein [Pseudoalteromonas phenolica]TMO58312.1 hypothetical protein CWC21_01130 [Pseudoalteromonas phenolica]
MRNKIIEGLVITLIFALGIFGLFETFQEWSTKDSVTVFIKMGPDKVFVGSNLWIGLTTNISGNLGLVFMGVMTVLVKLKHPKAGIVFAGMGMALLINWFVFKIFIV